MTTTALDAPPLLSDAQLQQMADEGYLLLRGLLDADTIANLKQPFMRAMDKQAQDWLNAGHITDVCADEPFETRYAALRKQYAPTHSNSWRRIIVSPELHAIWQHPRLVGVARSLLGDELYASQTWNGRPRAPHQLVQSIGWHQDLHYQQKYDINDGRKYSFWMPLVPVDESAGCLHVCPGSNHAGARPMVKMPNNGLVGLEDHEVEPYPSVACPMEPGDVLLFSELTFHRSGDNVSDRVRWSLDIRYFDATNQALREKDGPKGYYCFSASDPSRVEDYDTWSARYDYEGEF